MEIWRICVSGNTTGLFIHYPIMVRDGTSLFASAVSYPVISKHLRWILIVVTSFMDIYLKLQ